MQLKEPDFIRPPVEGQIGQRLAQERRRLNLTQDKLAEILEVSRQTVYIYEKGERYPDARQLQKFSIHGADILFIVNGTTSPEEHLRKGLEEISERVGQLLGKTSET